MIVLDTTVLVYAVGTDHPLQAKSVKLLEGAESGSLRVTSTVEVLQEFVHVRSRRVDRASAIRTARAFVVLLSPLLTVGQSELDAGLDLYQHHTALGTFDSILAATAIASGAEALVSADRGFAEVPRLRFVDLSSDAVDDLVPAQ